MRLRNQQSTQSEGAKERRQKFLRKLKFYSNAAALGAFSCATAAQGQIVVYDIPDVSITGNLVASNFIDIHADGPGNPDASAPEWQISTPSGAPTPQVRIDTTMTAGGAGDERGDHSDLICGGIACAGAADDGVIDVGEGNQLLSPSGYYSNSMPYGTVISRATLNASFYAGLAARLSGYPTIGYNLIGSGDYVGLEWAFNGPGSTDRRYGWAQVDVTPPNGDPNDFFTATLTKYAINMTPNQSIRAGQVPEPCSLALLAAGGGGLALATLRRRRNK